MPESGANDADLSAVWHLLSDPRRRCVLEQLYSIERTTLAALARGIESRSEVSRSDGETGTAASRRRIEIALAHDHLPRLADHGVIAYDPSTLEVVLTADSETRRLLEAVFEGHASVR